MPEVVFGKALQLRKFVSLAVPARRDDLDAAIEHLPDEVRKVDFVRRGEVDRDGTAAFKRVDGDRNEVVVDQLGANDLGRVLALFGRKRPAPRAHQLPNGVLCLYLLFHGVDYAIS